MKNLISGDLWKWAAVFGMGVILGSIDHRISSPKQCGLGYLEDPNRKFDYEPNFLFILLYAILFMAYALIGGLILKFFRKALHRRFVKNISSTILDSESTSKPWQKRPFSDYFFKAGTWLTLCRLSVWIFFKCFYLLFPESFEGL